MSGTGDDIKGRVKEAAGSLANDDDLRREGKLDQTTGKAKNKISEAASKVEAGVDAVADKLKGKGD